MNTCIKCGRNIPQGELFCAQCSKSPVIAELGVAGRSAAPAKKPAPRQPAPAPAPRTPAKKLRCVIIALCIALVLILALLVWQQAGLQVEKNRARTMQDEAQRQFLTLEQTQNDLKAAQEDLETLEQTLKTKEEEIKTLTSQLADSRSSQNQGEYDLSNMEKELETLQGEYDALLEEHDLMVEAVEAAAKYKEKAEFLDNYVVFVVNNNTKLYHTYDCEDFTHSNFWTYSPKLAEAQGFKPCGKCID